MTTEKHKALVRRYYDDLWNRWDLALADEIVAEDISFRGSLGVTLRGREGFKRYVETVRSAFPDFENRIEELIAEGDQVVARLTYRGTHRGELFGSAPTGKRVEYTGVGIFRLREGQIVEAWILGDTLALMRQVGAMPGLAR